MKNPPAAVQPPRHVLHILPLLFVDWEKFPLFATIVPPGLSLSSHILASTCSSIDAFNALRMVNVSIRSRIGICVLPPAANPAGSHLLTLNCYTNPNPNPNRLIYGLLAVDAVFPSSRVGYASILYDILLFRRTGSTISSPFPRLLSLSAGMVY